MRRWYVISPAYEEIDVIVDGQGPTELVRDVVEVDADTRRDALLLGVKLMRADRRRYRWIGYWCDDGHPFAGMRIEPSDFNDYLGANVLEESRRR